MKRIIRPGLPANLLTILTVMALAVSCSMFDETESHISGPDKIACEQFKDSTFAELGLVPLTNFNPAWSGSAVAGNIAIVIDSLKAHDLVVLAGLDSAYHLSRTGDSSYVALQSELTDVTVFYTDVLDLNVYTSGGQKIDFSSDIMPQETIAECREEENNTYEGNIIKVRLEYQLSGTDFLLEFVKNDNTQLSDFYLTVQNSN